MNFAKGLSGQAVEREALFGGAGSVKVLDLLGRLVAPPFSAVLYCELSAKGSVGSHQQLTDHEIVLGLEGEADICVGQQRQSIGPGGLVYLPQGALLAIDNRSSDKPFRYLIIKATGQPQAPASASPSP
jgi:quercetin dioxygenase-like cupin family protein